MKVQDADIILWNGLDLELWFRRFFRSLKGVPEFTVSKGVQPIKITKGPYKGKPNPHAWMSLKDTKIYIDNIVVALSFVDKTYQNYYLKRARNYKKKLDREIKPLIDSLKVLPSNRQWLVTSEGAFSYLTRDIGFKEVYLWPINSDQQGSIKQVLAVIETVKKNNIPVVFSESTVSPDLALQVASETDAVYGGVLYVDSLSSIDGPVPSFIKLLKKTYSAIAQSLSL